MSDFLNWELTNKMHNLGYDGKTLMYIDDEEDIINDDSAELIGAKPAILTSAAFRWFREKHGLRIRNYGSINYSGGLSEYFEIFKYGYGTSDKSLSIEIGALTYEEAELACLRELIEIVKQK